VATATLALTDRLAIRIYVNVGGRTITLHTENGHLCQVVTTLSKGMVSLNNLTDQSQYLAVGTSGTDFNIASSGDTHTFNIPSASLTNRGLVTTGSQTFAGAKTFENNLNINGQLFVFGATGYGGGVSYRQGNILATSDGSTTLEFPDESSIKYYVGQGSNTYKNFIFDVANITIGATRTYNLPDLSGTFALTSDLSSYVPYTGATGDVDLGVHSLTAFGVTANSFYAQGNGTQGGYLYLKQGTIPYGTLAGSNSISADGTKYIYLSDAGSNNSKTAIFQLGSITNNTERTYTLPDASGTLALTSNLSAYLPLTGGTLTGALSGTSISLSSSLSCTSASVGSTLQVGSTAILYGNVAIKSNSATSYFGLNVIANGNNNFIALNHTGSVGIIETEFSTGGSHTPMALVTGGSERMRILSNGNIGIGTASPNSYTNLTTLTINGTSGSVLDLTTNGVLYGEIYSLANELRIDAVGASGVLKLLTNSTEKMRILSNGNVGIGTTGSAWDTITNLQVKNASLGGFFGNTYLGANTYYASAWKYITTDFASRLEMQSGRFEFYTAPSGTAGNNISFTQAMTITQGGNVGIGTSSPNSLLQVGNFSNNSILTLAAEASSVSSIYFGDGTGAALYRGFVEYAHETDTMRIGTSSTERMRITSGGNIGIGMTGYGDMRLVVRGATSNSSNFGLRIENSGASNLFQVRNDGLIETALGTGTVYSTGGALSVVSDMNLKIEDGYIDNALEKVLNLKPRYFHWKEESKLPTDLRQLGFYAQEVNLALGEEAANTPKENQYFGINDRAIIAFLTKAIQEQQAQIEELSNKIVALESK